MNCALLCPGPSLASWPDDTFAAYPLRIAVNRAVLRYPCHAWVMLDWKSITRIEDAPVIPLYTCLQSHHALRGRWTRFAEFDIRNTEHRGKTAISALFVAKELGATSIDVFGADWTDAPDFDGVTLVGTERHAARWEKESQQWADAVVTLGIPVVRVEGRKT